MQQDSKEMHSRLTKELGCLFQLLKRSTISGREIKTNILQLSVGVFEFLNGIKIKDDDTINELILIEYELKECITNLLLYKSKELILASNPLEYFITQMERSNKEISLISIVFSKVFKEKNEIQKKTHIEPSLFIRSFYYQKLAEHLLLSNSLVIFSDLIKAINKIRYGLGAHRVIDDLLTSSRDNLNYTNSITEYLKDKEQLDTYELVTNVLSMFSDIDFITEMKFNCKNEFDDFYKRNLGKIYNVYGNSILSIKNCNIEVKLNQLLETIFIETLLNESLFTHTLGFKNVLNNELLMPNLSFIQSIFCQNIENFDTSFKNHINNIETQDLDINKLFLDIFKIPNFIELYIKIYDYSTETVREICYNISNHIQKYFENIDKKSVDLEFMFLSYVVLRTLETELITAFTPSNEEVYETDIYSSFLDNKPFVLNIHNIFKSILEDTSHTKLIEFLTLFSQTKFTKKTDEEFNRRCNIINKMKDNHDYNTYTEALKYICFCIKNKDEFEELYKKNIIRKIITSGIDNYNLENLEKMIGEISKLPDMSLHINKNILKSFEIGNELSKEFNILYETTLPDQSRVKGNDFLNLKHLPEGVCDLKPNEYKISDFKSEHFKKYLSIIKDGFKDYYKLKYDRRELKWSDNLSNIDLAYKIGKYEITLCVNYKQADLLFLIQYELDELLSNIKTDNSVSEIDKTNKNYVEFIKQNESILESEFIKYLIEKKMYKKTVYKVNDSIELNLIEINEKLNLKRDKKIDCYKLRFKEKVEENKEPPKPKKVDLVFFRSDYVQSNIMKICKRRRESFIKEAELFSLAKDGLKNRFEVEKPLFSTSIEKLVKNDYLEKREVNITGDGSDIVTEYKYLA